MPAALNRVLLLTVSVASTIFLFASASERTIDGNRLLPRLAVSLEGDAVEAMTAGVPDEIDGLRSEAFKQTTTLKERFTSEIKMANTNGSISLAISVILSLIESFRVCFLPWLSSLLRRRRGEVNGNEDRRAESSFSAWLLWGCALAAIIFSCLASQATNEAFCLKQREAEIVEEYVVLEESTAGLPDGHPAVVKAASDFRKHMFASQFCKKDENR
ncbi:hypothetical protein [Botrimarina colliarenosi]|uniref:hypothetical protein n=1 Tax=Botrimarina colliarenosi TaxID=2528001 RepID=UPI0011B796CB|nr:hypothetical protein [Botrimarina colliarenosi]